jgi:shikimate dehydrogenase
MSRVFSFYGVTTGGSSIMTLFPRWAEQLDLGDVVIAGTDLPIGAAPEVYRARVAQLRDDPDELGALITTHKIDLFRACRDQFDEVDELAALTEETSCLSKRDGRLVAHAKDPISAGRTLDAMLAAGTFADGAEAAILGAGGSAIAIALHLLTRRPEGDRPRRLRVADPDPGRLSALGAILARAGASAPECLLTPASGLNDELLDGLPAGSLVVNATGRGKDTPGTPISDAACLPEGGCVWELNYRGTLDFLAQARAQEQRRGLAVHDGWTYFIHGWSAVIEEVFHRPLTPTDLEELTRLADEGRAAPAVGP